MEENNNNNFFSSMGNFITDFIEKSSSLGKNWEEIQSFIEAYEKLSNLSEEEMKSLASYLEEYFQSVPKEDNRYDKDSPFKDNTLVNITNQYLTTLKMPKTKAQSIVFSPENQKILDIRQQFGIDEDKKIINEIEIVRFYLDEIGKQNLHDLGVLAEDPSFCGTVFDIYCSCILETGWKFGDSRNIEDKNIYINEAMIYKKLTNSNRKITPKMTDLIRRCIDTTDTTLLYLDGSNHYNSKNKKAPKIEYKSRETITHTRREEYICNGHKVEGYKILVVPFLLEYACAVKQLRTVDLNKIAVLDDNSQKRLQLQWKLSYFIDDYTHSNKKKLPYCEIRYTTLFQKCSIFTNDKTLLKRHKDLVYKTLLPKWKSNGFINDFEELPSGKEKRGKIRIYINQNEKE